MPKNRRLNDLEKGKIDAFSECGWSCRKISDRMVRSKTVVSNYLKLKEKYGKKNTGGRPKSLSQREERKVVRLAATGRYSSNEIKKEMGLKLTKATICKIINNSDHMEYVPRARKPVLKPVHIKQRLEFGKRVMTWSDKWLEVIFSDEKKFNLDGPDGCRYYWHDLRKEKEIFSKRQMGGYSVMVWAAFGYNSTSDIAFIENRLNASIKSVS